MKPFIVIMIVSVVGCGPQATERIRQTLPSEGEPVTVKQLAVVRQHVQGAKNYIGATSVDRKRALTHQDTAEVNCIDTSTAMTTAKWSVPEGMSSATFGADGTIYILSNVGKLYSTRPGQRINSTGASQVDGFEGLLPVSVTYDLAGKELIFSDLLGRALVRWDPSLKRAVGTIELEPILKGGRFIDVLSDPTNQLVALAMHSGSRSVSICNWNGQLSMSVTSRFEEPVVQAALASSKSFVSVLESGRVYYSDKDGTKLVGSFKPAATNRFAKVQGSGGGAVCWVGNELLLVSGDGSSLCAWTTTEGEIVSASPLGRNSALVGWTSYGGKSTNLVVLGIPTSAFGLHRNLIEIASNPLPYRPLWYTPTASEFRSSRQSADRPPRQGQRWRS